MEGLIKQKDFRIVEVSGTTASSANTEAKFRHGKNEVPWLGVVAEGNAYIARNGIGPNELDVRSTSTSQDFKVLLFFNG
jgi:hypothetical protein